MILSFKKQFDWGAPTDFINKIITGVKIHSFRVDKNKRWKPGTPIQHATGARTKYYTCFKNDTQCQNIEIIRVRNRGRKFQGMELKVGKYWRKIPIIWQIEIAKNDGFDDLNDFYKYFYLEKQDLRVIHWTSLLYSELIYGDR